MTNTEIDWSNPDDPNLLKLYNSDIVSWKLNVSDSDWLQFNGQKWSKINPPVYWASVYAVGDAIAVGPYRRWKWRAWMDYAWFVVSGKDRPCGPVRWS